MILAASGSLPAAVISSIPSPTVAGFHLGPLVIRAYALCILTGIVIAVWWTGKRLAARGYEAERALDISAYAVPFGIVGGRLYHVITTPQPYFGEGGQPLDAFKIWNGGLGIWGAIALGALGAWLGARRYGVSFRAFADAAAPGVAVAQAVGRLGNWFNNELYGRPTDAPWGLVIHRWDEPAARAVTDSSGTPEVLGTFQPTFLYELLFLLVLAAVLVRYEKRRRAGGRALAPGQLFGLYVAGYPVGRIVVELLRSDDANLVLGLRVNVWTSILVFILGVAIYRLNAGTPPLGQVAAAGLQEDRPGRSAPSARAAEDTEGSDEEDVANDSGDARKASTE